ncbi:CDP-diacylglycerol---inositol 3-phosphatidyltransferase [Chondrus crispus]|uniref:CDP-diacylglycerol--inositol 3-phosphatidyltransferase n=1 Tax=Chondrus crispus TaxID=2769 RepID=R7QP90_CHOCR|nr:CDP-diacylglycerol---inositol 3-phosphatidyltransferase [Chondrus crispus]CDF39583.1 CDP-diacylglycerol---inositol 3-phosphatidyltransferase [Chondrus crispus]|eukprot:XP_005709877.1 CDP-diacylglycerol---inositol 3-phosphatidyltransferase [Chondrus crispus]
MPSLRHWPVCFYVPNVIGYLRIVLSVVALTHWRSPWKFFAYYFTGFVLDAADGLAARTLDQTSAFGAQLDMLTDRCATAALLTILGALYPPWAFLCYALIFLDGYSHWLQMVASACADAASHKSATNSELLKFYYWRPALTVVCSLNEMCFLALYMKKVSSAPDFLPGLSLFDAILYLAAPVCALKQVISLFQVASAHETIADSL